MDKKNSASRDNWGIVTKLGTEVHVGEICKWLEMQRDFALRMAGRGRLNLFPVEYKTGSRRPRQNSRQEDRHIVKNSRVQPTASLAIIQAHVGTSLGPLCLLEPYEGAWLKDIWDCGAHYVCWPLTHPPSMPPFRVVPRTRKLDCNGMESGRL
ncbi:hypothetical protein TNCV_4203221 [Trichonephila clavipes]|uniref:Uncharacterized protein n=1 Tax=Trichonephila clavipes TaxID=2585209 RepID=A0A8X6S7C1_TRICX|nr:hypothetical protein TNCV_4203221 [Trichonephila clavipes]